jgi:hypothetical protein
MLDRSSLQTQEEVSGSGFVYGAQHRGTLHPTTCGDQTWQSAHAVQRRSRSFAPIDPLAGLLHGIFEGSQLPRITMDTSSLHRFQRRSSEPTPALPTPLASLLQSCTISSPSTTLSSDYSDPDAAISLLDFTISSLQLQLRRSNDHNARRRNAVEKRVRMRGKKPAGRMQ